MSIASEITRLQNAKASLKAAINAKGGSLTTETLDQYASAVDDIATQKEEQAKTISPTTSSQDVLPDTGKVLSKVTVNAIPTETKSQQPSLGSGNQTINATSGKFMTSFTITKDTTNHIASNIRSGKTLYGVTGSLQPAKEEETKTVTPNFASGNVVVTPTSGKVMTQVTFSKDTTNHKAENIKKDITLYGITGTLESGGADLSRVIPLAFKLFTSKPSGSMNLNYSITSSMLDKRFFFDINGNSYLPSQVSVYFNNTLKGTANQNITLSSTSSQIIGQNVTFKVGTIEVGLPTYDYSGDYDAPGTGIWTEGAIIIAWSNSTGTIITPSRPFIRLFQAPNDLFDNFPYYDILNYWKADNMFNAMQMSNLHTFRVGWSAFDSD